MNRRAFRFDQEFGFTLIEILMAVVVIGILATVAMRSVQSSVEQSRFTETQEEMEELAWAIAGNPNLYANGMRSDFGYVGDVGALPSSLDDLVSNPGGYATWNGPYVSKRFSEDSDGFKKDAWANTYSYSGGVAITSTGGGSQVMTKNFAAAASDLTNTTIIGTVSDAGGNPPGDSAIAVAVTITYPNGTGGITSSSVNPGSGGSFSLSNIPTGIHQIEAVYRATDDTVTVYAAALPRDGATVTLRLPNAPFASSGGGGGGSGTGIEFVPGTARTTGGCNDDIEFDIFNSGSTAYAITSMTVEYVPSVYFRRIRWDGSTVFNETNPRAGSGDVCSFSSTKTIGVSDVVSIRIQDFRDAPTGGNCADVSNVDFTITFSNGDVITFNSGS